MVRNLFFALFKTLLFKLEACLSEEVAMTTSQDQFFIYFNGRWSKKTHFYLKKEIEEAILCSPHLSAKDQVEFEELMNPIKYAAPLPEREVLIMRQRIDYLVMEIEQNRELKDMKSDSISNNRHLENTLKIA